MATRFLIWCVDGYKKLLSPLQRGNNCRFLPTCSEYAREALEVHGAVKGLILAFYRVLRCNPLCKRGYDPVPAKGRWRASERALHR